MKAYFRPLVCYGWPRPPDALPLAGGPGWFRAAVRQDRTGVATVVDLDEIPADWRERLSAARAPIAGLSLDRPNLMGILNVTPDSFSDGGQHDSTPLALSHARNMAAAGAVLIDVGGESTRPGANCVPEAEEIARIEPVVSALAKEIDVPVSIDTRKARVAETAARAGARLVNDVSGFTFDAKLAPFCARAELPVCIMHAQGDPATMSDNPQYDDVLLDVYDFLEAQVEKLESLGIPRHRIVVDPGIGFGKTLAHNLTLLQGLSLFHGIGCALLLGASRKRFIGTISGAEPASARVPGSIAAALFAAQQGAQILRVHDVAETAQALSVWQAISEGAFDES